MLRWLKVGLESGDQLAGHLDFAVGDLNFVEPVEQLDLGRGHNFVGVDHGRNHELAIDRANCGQVLLGAHHKAGDADLACLFHRGDQELVGLLGIGTRGEVVLGVVENGVDVS